MIEAKRTTHWLRFAIAVLVLGGASCSDENPEGPPITDPGDLVERVDSCRSSQGSLSNPAWDLYVTDSAWDELLEHVKADVEVDAQLCLNGVLESIGLELQGASSRVRDKKSFKIKFRHDHLLSDVGYDDGEDSPQVIDKVFLKGFWGDQSLIREAVAFDMWREMGHNAPRTSFVNLRINGEYWGLYGVVEPIDKDYLRRNDYPASGHLFKATRTNGSYADFKPGRDLVKAFEDKTFDTADAPRADLENLVTLLQDTDLDMPSIERDIDPVFPIDDYLDRMVWIAITRNGDAVSQNFYLYNTPHDGQDFWYQIPWDSDLCMGASWRDRDAVVAPEVSLMLTEGNYYSERLLMVPDVSQRYASRFREVLDNVLTQPVLMHHLEQRANVVRDDLLEDQVRWERNVGPDEAFDVIHDFLEKRPPVLREALDSMWPG